MHLLFSLTRCPVCRQRSSSSRGCCRTCAGALFHTSHENLELTLGKYEGRLEQAVRALKFHGATRLADLFGAGLAEGIGETDWQPELVCAVPLHTRRRLQRGYNQSALVARHAARRLGLPYRRLLKRTRATGQQARLSLRERQDNVAGAFRSKPVPHRRVLLVDDVITSGATTVECSLALLEAGAYQVYVAAVAKAGWDTSNQHTSKQ